LAELLNLSSSLKLLDRMHLPWCIPANGLLEQVDGLSRQVGVMRNAWQKARAKKPQHSTCFDETIQ